MRIALFTDTYPPQINGVAASTSILRNELEKHGHDVVVVTTYKGSGKHKWDDDHKVLRLAGVHLRIIRHMKTIHIMSTSLILVKLMKSQRLVLRSYLVFMEILLLK